MLPLARNHVNVVRSLLARQDIDVEAGMGSPLILASPKCNQHTVQLLLQHDSVNINRTDDEECTAIGEAITFDHDQIVRLLLSDPRIDINIDMSIGG